MGGPKRLQTCTIKLWAVLSFIIIDYQKSKKKKTEKASKNHYLFNFVWKIPTPFFRGFESFLKVF
jgi:hypothetical protein